MKNQLKKAMVVPFVVLLCCTTARAQELIEWNVPNANWNVPTSWNPDFVPDVTFAEQASINNGGVSFIDAAVTNPHAILIGRTAPGSGTLEIRNNGAVVVPPNEMITAGSGITAAGQAGEGHLIVLPGGSLTTETLSSNGSADSSITVGGSGAGSATIQVNGNSNLQRTTNLLANADFQTEALSFGNDSNYNVEVTSAGNPLISVANGATLNGTLNLDFSGFTPAVSDTWDILDAGSIAGSFDNITASGTAPAGFGLVVSNVAGGSNGQLARAGFEAQLKMVVDRTSGEVNIVNAAQGVDIAINGYFLTSDSAFDVGGWSSLNSQGQSAFRESNPSPLHVGELSLDNEFVVAGESSLDLGELYGFQPSALGEAPPVPTFEYTLTDSDQVRTGLVEMVGAQNDLVLVVDPSTGDTFLQNQSEFGINIDSYYITSEADSLTPGTWTSLEDAGSPFRESNPASNHVGELSLDSSFELGAFSDAIPLGKLFGSNAEQDLVFQFNVEDGEILNGTVHYGQPLTFDVQPTTCGDFDGDGDIDSADLTTVISNWTGALPAGQGDKVFSDGDCDGDGDVDSADRTGLITSWTGAMAGNLTDGDAADLVYDPATGNVTLDASDTASEVLISFVIATDENNMNEGNFDIPFIDVGTNTDATSFQIGQTDPLNQGKGPLVDLGNILPTGISSVEALADYLTLAEYASALGAGGTLDLRVVPEPSSVSLLLLATLWSGFTIRSKNRK